MPDTDAQLARTALKSVPQRALGRYVMREVGGERTRDEQLGQMKARLGLTLARDY